MRRWIQASLMGVVCSFLACVVGNKGLDDKSTDKGKVEDRHATSQTAGGDIQDSGNATNQSGFVNAELGKIVAELKLASAELKLQAGRDMKNSGNVGVSGLMCAVLCLVTGLVVGTAARIDDVMRLWQKVRA